MITKYNNNITIEYSIVISKQAKKKLKSLPGDHRTRITEQIVLLGHDPGNHHLDIKKLVGLPYYRLRVEDWRVIYERDDEIRVISIEKIDARGGVYQ